MAATALVPRELPLRVRGGFGLCLGEVEILYMLFFEFLDWVLVELLLHLVLVLDLLYYLGFRVEWVPGLLSLEVFELGLLVFAGIRGGTVVLLEADFVDDRLGLD